MLIDRRNFLWIVIVLAACAAMSNGTRAQALKATILGVATDSSGAAIPGATISVKNMGTGIVRTTATDDQGRYNVPDLDIGTYEVDAEKAGFKRIAHGGIELTVGSQVVVDAALQVGAAEQTVTVEGQVTQVDTTSSALGALSRGRRCANCLSTAATIRNYCPSHRVFKQLTTPGVASPGEEMNTPFREAGLRPGVSAR